MSCEGCLANKFSVLENYRVAKKAAQERANELNHPVFLNRDNDEYTISNSTEPNTVEAVLPDK